MRPATQVEPNLSQLEVGMVIKNYRQLCELLGITAYKSGSNQDKAQKKNLKRFFDWERSGQKIVILDIYDEPLPVIDKRSEGGNNVYLKYIETILLKYVVFKQDQTCYITKNQLWTILGMINSNYKKIPLSLLQEEPEFTDVTNWELQRFYMRCNAKLNSILFSALNNLQNRSLIKWETQTIIITPSERNESIHEYAIATDNELRAILSVEREIMKEMGFESKSHLACCMKLDVFFQTVNDKLYDLYGWIGKYDRFKLIFNKSDVRDALKYDEYKLQMYLLNDVVIEAIDKNAQTVVDNRMKKAIEEYEEYKSLCYGEVPPLEQIDDIWTYPDFFVDIQKRLSQKFLSIRYIEKEGVDDTTDIDDMSDLEELFADLG